MSKHNYFENRGGAVYCLRDCEVIVSKHNVDELLVVIYLAYYSGL